MKKNQIWTEAETPQVKIITMITSNSNHKKVNRQDYITHIYTHAYTNACMHTHKHAHMHASMHTHTRKHAHTHTHTHTHTHSTEQHIHQLKCKTKRVCCMYVLTVCVCVCACVCACECVCVCVWESVCTLRTVTMDKILLYKDLLLLLLLLTWVWSSSWRTFFRCSVMANTRSSVSLSSFFSWVISCCFLCTCCQNKK